MVAVVGVVSVVAVVGLGTVVSQEPITWSLHTCCTLESTLSDKELFLEQAFSRN